MTATLNDDKSWLGERYDAGAGLQYLNARYYDPELAMFLQPDWFDPTDPMVGTNRYAYGLGNPIGYRDPTGNRNDNEGDHGNVDETGGSGTGSGDSPVGGGSTGSGHVSGGSDDDSSGEEANEGPSGRVDGPVVQVPGQQMNQPITHIRVIEGRVMLDPKLLPMLKDPKFSKYVIDQLMRSGYLSNNINDMKEVAGHIYINQRTGEIRYVPQRDFPGSDFNNTEILPPSPRSGEMSFLFHTHPGSEIAYYDTDGQKVAGAGHPSRVDIEVSRLFNTPGIVVTGRGDLYGYDKDGGWGPLK